MGWDFRKYIFYPIYNDCFDSKIINTISQMENSERLKFIDNIIEEYLKDKYIEISASKSCGCYTKYDIICDCEYDQFCELDYGGECDRNIDFYNLKPNHKFIKINDETICKICFDNKKHIKVLSKMVNFEINNIFSKCEFNDINCNNNFCNNHIDNIDNNIFNQICKYIHKKIIKLINIIIDPFFINFVTSLFLFSFLYFILTNF